MLRKTTIGKINHHQAKSIYQAGRSFVDSMLSAGKISAENADKVWATYVAAELGKNGLEISKKIKGLL